MSRFDLDKMESEEQKLENKEEFEESPFRSSSVVIDEAFESPGLPKRTSDRLRKSSSFIRSSRDSIKKSFGSPERRTHR